MSDKMTGKIYIKTIEVGGIYPAIYSMRNPMSSWDKSDSKKCDGECKNRLDCKTYGQLCIGEEDLKLSQKLARAGSEHSKYLRMIQVWADFKMPRYWWSEFDTYHHNTKNSTSTMHTIFKEHITYKDLYLGNMRLKDKLAIGKTLTTINKIIDIYNKTQDYDNVIDIKRLLPESFIQMRTVNTNYAELMNVYHQRKNHRLKDEWVEVFCKWCEELPLFYELCIAPFEVK